MTARRGRDVWDPELERRRCTADAKGRLREGADPGSDEARCLKRPIKGGTVCRNHGGAAPQVQQSARQRLLTAVDPALGALIEVVDQPVGTWACLEPGGPKSNGVWKIVGPTFAERTRAAEAILDRTGYPRRAEITLTDGVDEIEAILDELEDGDDE